VIRLLPVLLSIALLVGCDYSPIAGSGWPCDQQRECAAGWGCVNGVCVQGSADYFEPEQPASDSGGLPDVGAPDSVANTDVGTGTGGWSDVPIGEEPVIAENFEAPGDKPRGLAVGGSGVWIGDEGTRKVYLLDVGDGSQFGSGDLPANGLLMDLAWDEPGQRLVALMTSPPSIEVVWPTAQAETLTTNTTSQVLSFDGTYLLTVEGQQLKRWTTGSPAQVHVSSSITTGCEHLAASQTHVFRLCDEYGQPTVDLSQTVHVFDIQNLATSPKVDHLDVAVDVTPITGFDVKGTTVWVTGRGYGKMAGRVIKLEL